MLAIIAASGVILTAGYILWTIQRVYLGPEYKGPHPEALSPINGRENHVAITLVGGGDRAGRLSAVDVRPDERLHRATCDHAR